MIIESRIDSVKVYARGATVVRKVEIPQTDETTIEIPGLPLSLSDPSVRVSVDEVAGGSLVAGETRIGLYVKPRSELPPEPDKEELLRLEREIALRQRDLEQLDVEMALLGAIGVPERPKGEKGKPPPASPLAARVVLEQLTDEGISARLDEARRIRQEVAKLEEDAALVRERFERARQGRRIAAEEITKTVIVTLRREGGPFSRARLSLEYFVPGAKWAPQYQLRIAREGEAATIVLRAVIAQRTGEDWRGVKLWLSTAYPTSWTELPKLASIRIGRAQPEPATLGFRPPPQGSAALFADFDRDRGQIVPPAGPGWSPPSRWVVLPLPALSDLLPAMAEPSLSLEEDADDMETTKELRAVVSRGPAGFGAPAAFAAPPQAAAYGPPPPMGGALPPPMPPPAPARPAPKPAAREREDGTRSLRKMKRPSLPADEIAAAPLEGFGEEERSLPPPARVPFSALCLSAPDAGERGRLRPSDRRSEYIEILGRSNLSLDFEPLPVVEHAERLALSVSQAPLPAGTVDPRSSAGHWDYAYSADDRVDVPSDGTFCSVPLGEREAPCSLSYVVVPREDQNVFRMAAIENPTRAPLLPGPVEVYVGGEYVLTSNLPQVAPRERFRLGLGVEQAIKCARNTQFREQRSGAAVVAMAELWHEIDIRLVNRLPRPIKCEVRERIPQPAKDAEVVVEEASVTPAWEPWEQKDSGPVLVGGRRWLVEVPARSEQALVAKYVVKIYANNELVGGNRREV